MEIKPYGKNPKKHPEIQLKAIAKSIKEFGWQQPIVIDKNNTIIVGHGRWFAYEKYKDEMKLPEPEIKKAGNLTKQQVGAYRLADNKLNESDWDMGLAVQELKELDDYHFDLTGFSLDDLKSLEEDDFDAQAEYDKIYEPLSKLGDLWQLGEHRLLCGDSTQKASYEELFATQGRSGTVRDGQLLADMIFTDPPYNVGYDYDWLSSLHKGKKVKHNFFSDKKSDEDYYKFIKDVFKNSFDYSKETASFYCWYASKHHILVERGIKDAGWLVSQLLIWIKNYPVLSLGQDFHRTQEPCLHGWKKGKKHFRNKLGNLRDVINWDDLDGLLDIWYEKRDKLADYKHPTQKPIRLAERALKKSSRVGDIILEMFTGSGSTLLACEQLKRKMYGIELDPIYCDVIIKRYEQYTGKKAKRLN